MAADRSPTLAELSEGDVLARVLARFERGGVAGSETLVGPGDDSAVLRAPDGRFVVTTDMMVHGPDFRLAWSTPDDLGWKAAASNLADIAAMGARPTGLVVALAAPQTLGIDVVEGIARGLAAGCAAMAPGCGVVGGDLSASATLTLSITAFGSLDGRPPVLRSGAQPGDVLATAGPLGRAGLGLRLLFEQAREEGEPSAALAARLRQHFPALLDAQLRPTAPIAQGMAAGGIATAMMDVSDGVVLDARRMARASGVVIDLDPAAVDVHARDLLTFEVVSPDLARALVLGGGEDHAMLACFGSRTPLPAGFTALGVVREGTPEVRLGGAPLVERGGWDPYLGWDGSKG
ncbi:thiamine-phosphate kinase [Rathayibacter iranicus]|uniref:Thiamine-monophosphate kinase n=2 Tax=Rathayibacter iranicus TaxID=59737 RepID=A0AAD1AC51_9MICO|nr:thiamine-phosphate kinase [Rathayibacter iranicus]AZZ55518.1 thiamine-phosphate kinase [Rathayibacter iranicus]MWV31650.1 thiamine-phosphate kinase [Rathayibacter iranicus NCPPB 2253 = VKM Ac-1602]PPI48307.1 thiamine-phosphate kinase [Rathayibacter iranicus]PPI60938.1 thiamine-phosphate kinase [Rathayibacter iranicus]PPI72533.1 thiamine-phosphate kinase [Rathayibacter iranicus]